ncbi:acyl-CoA dehydrogenase family protein [Gordonia rubripertincta]|uniref:Acyl-[acyl-carrier-protein] dehydrogenase MbtN n=1 Tax=Gordonia rubripertincta TaxID=36822 RepID=A0ABT4N0F7_GORRU|nr:acyl-CoA dehydrogenase family protein [Gordonia rubripertincta]MCZ4551437.1 acyl-CoA dehydrogenase family protein [Gordonia rubripertincta]
MKRRLFEADHDAFRESFRRFLDSKAVPFVEEWESAGVTPRDFWKQAGALGFLGFEAPAEFGGVGIRDFRYNAVIQEEVAASGIATDGFALHNDILAPYLIEYADDEQRARWLPGFVSGDMVTAIAMTEPGTGSDLAAITTSAEFDGDYVIVDGSKTFITNGSSADLVLVLARTGERDGRGMTLVAIERGTPGLVQRAPLKKAGRRGQDTAEIVIERCRVPRANIVGEEGGAFDLVKRNLARERLSIAVYAVASARAGLHLALEHTRARKTFRQPIASHQTVLHGLADMHTDIEIAQSHVDACIVALGDDELTAHDAAGIKYWATDLEGRVLDRSLQYFGGYGYMDEYPISRRWRDARVQRIYGGANEIMRDIVGRQLTR